MSHLDQIKMTFSDRDGLVKSPLVFTAVLSSPSWVSVRVLVWVDSELVLP